jgi:type IV pilus assembly protein PilW
VQAHQSNRRRHAGLSLIEVMIALVIGIVLLTGIMQIFGSTQLAFSTAEGASRIQENARFALDILRNDMRMAAHVGCRSERHYVATDEALFNHAADPATNFAAAPFALRIDMSMEAFEFAGSGPGQQVDLSGGVSTGVGVGSFSPSLPPELADLTADAVAGSDIIVLRYLSSDNVRSVLPNIATNTLSVVNPVDATFFERGQIYGVSNCKKLSLVQALSDGPLVAVGSGGVNAVDWVAEEDGYAPPGTSVHRYEFVVYYVGIDAASGEPSLKMRRLDPNRASLISGPQAVVEGVESMQLVFGADVGAGRDDVLDRYFTAVSVPGLAANPREAWGRVLSVRVGLLMRSTNTAAALRDGASPPIRVADTVFAVADDRRVRQTFETSITMRNRVRN